MVILSFKMSVKKAALKRKFLNARSVLEKNHHDVVHVEVVCLVLRFMAISLCLENV